MQINKKLIKQEEKEVNLWSGTWNSGTINLSDDIYNYNFCIVRFANKGTCATVPIYKSDTWFRGTGGYCTTTNVVHYVINATIDSNNRLTFVASQSSVISSSQTVGRGEDLTVSEIIGVR